MWVGSGMSAFRDPLVASCRSANGPNADEILMMESVEQDKISRSKNQIEAVMSSMQKRPGVFDDVEVA